MSSLECEGALYVEVSKTWDEMFCTISGKKFQAFKRIRQNIPATKTNKAELVLEFDILVNECECKIIKYGLAELSKLMKNSKLSETPYFFSVTILETVYKLAASTEDERSRWIVFIKNLARAKERKSDAWVATGFLEGNYPAEVGVNRFGGGQQTSGSNQMLPSQRAGMQQQSASPLGSKRPSQIRKSTSGMESSPAVGKRKELAAESSQTSEALVGGGREPPEDGGRNRSSSGAGGSAAVGRYQFDLDAADEEQDSADSLCCRNRDYFFGVKVDTLIRLVEVCTAFPFVIVVSALNLSNRYTFLRSVTAIRLMNFLIYIAPPVYVQFLLSQFESVALQRLAIGFYILLYLLPVGFVVLSKVQVSTSTSKIEEGTFCFKPARTVRVTQANFYALFGFAMEWIQHVLYVLPVGIVTSATQTKLSDFPPYLSFEVYFWICIASVFICGLIIVLNAVLKGKLHYKFQSSYLVWFFLYNVGSPMFVTIVTILFMSLWCDYSSSPPSLIQQPSIECYGDQHVVMARAALTAVAMYIIQHTLLPSGTFKETMRDNDLEIMFVPVYLQAHYLLKVIFCGVYVYFYEDNFVRVIVLTIINILLLMLNNFMKPCSVTWVNLLRDTFFIHAVLSGIQSLNYLAWPINTSTKGMVISALVSNILFSTIGMLVYYVYTTKSTEYTIATAFLDLEWQVSRGGSVHPRVLEPLISLTLSTEKEDWDIAKKYIGQLVWLISYPNMRVQFQSAWGLANLALLDDDGRMKIHEAGGTKTLFEWYMDMEFVVQLEALAAMANLTLSMDVAEEMVARYKCIPFFIDLISSNKLKHAQFSAIALSNLARKESFRDMIRRSGGITALVGCIMSHDYQKRRHGCRALANMALSPSKEIEQVFESKGLIDKILKMALRKEIETQREVVALIRNLACHARLRPLLLDRGVMNAVNASKMSVFEDVLHWCDEITALLEREISGGGIDLKALIRREGAKGSAIGEADIDLLKKMEPLKGQVEWSTWGSKLESIFSPVFSSVPNLVSSQWVTSVNAPMEIFLPAGLSKAALQKCRDSLSYVVLEKPLHGKLNEYTTLSDYLTYTPSEGFSGTDFFTYRMQLGAINTAPATIAIVVEDDNNEASDHDVDDIEKGNGTRGSAGRSPKSRRGRDRSGVESFEIETEVDSKSSPAKRGAKRSPVPADDEEEGGGGSSRKQKSRVASGNHTPFMQSLMKKMSIAGSPKPDAPVDKYQGEELGEDSD